MKKKNKDIFAIFVQKQETEYYRSILSNKNDKNRSLWKTFGNILNNKKCKKRKIDNIIVNDNSITNENALTEEFNTFFVNISKYLADKFKDNKPNSSNFKQFLDDPQTQSFFLFNTNEMELGNLFKT